MSNRNQPQSITDAARLLPFIELEEIRTYSISAERKEPESRQDNSDEMRAQIRHDPDRIELRVKHIHHEDIASFTIDLAAIFRLSEPLEITATAIQEFAEKVAFMTLVPYLREGIATMAAKLGVQIPLLAIVRQGEIQFTKATP